MFPPIGPIPSLILVDSLEPLRVAPFLTPTQLGTRVLVVVKEDVSILSHVASSVVAHFVILIESPSGMIIAALRTTELVTGNGLRYKSLTAVDSDPSSV